MLFPVSVHLVLIRVEHVDRRLLLQRLRRLKECVRRQQIVMIQQAHKIAGRHSERLVCISGDALIFRKLLHTDAGVFLRILRKHAPHHVIFRAGIHNAKLPVIVGLALHRFYHLPQKRLRRLICRNRNAEFPRIFKFFSALRRQSALRRAIRLIPGTVGNLLRLHALLQTDQKFLYAEVLQIAQSFFDIIPFQLFECFHLSLLSFSRINQDPSRLPPSAPGRKGFPPRPQQIPGSDRSL